MIVLNFNRANLSGRPVSILINQLIEQSEPPSENFRQYLGASAMGTECLRRIQYDWIATRGFRHARAIFSIAGIGVRSLVVST